VIFFGLDLIIAASSDKSPASRFGRWCRRHLTRRGRLLARRSRDVARDAGTTDAACVGGLASGGSPEIDRFDLGEL
jgi:hypothetical protein